MCSSRPHFLSADRPPLDVFGLVASTTGTSFQFAVTFARSYNPERRMRTSDPFIAEQPATHGVIEKTTPWTAANFLTLVRIALVFPFLYFILEGRLGLALALFFLASLTDFVDG